MIVRTDKSSLVFFSYICSCTQFFSRFFLVVHDLLIIIFFRAVHHATPFFPQWAGVSLLFEINLATRQKEHLTSIFVPPSLGCSEHFNVAKTYSVLIFRQNTKLNYIRKSFAQEKCTRFVIFFFFYCESQTIWKLNIFPPHLCVCVCRGILFRLICQRVLLSINSNFSPSIARRLSRLWSPFVLCVMHVCAPPFDCFSEWCIEWYIST